MTAPNSPQQADLDELSSLTVDLTMLNQVTGRVQLSRNLLCGRLTTQGAHNSQDAALPIGQFRVNPTLVECFGCPPHERDPKKLVI